jgi:GTP pyrophosphokinase
MSPERLIDVRWSEELNDSYPVTIRIRSADRVGLLADVTSVITRNKANIISGHTETGEYGIVSSYFTLSVTSTEQLGTIIKEIKKVKKVRDVKRIVTSD